MKNRLEHDFLGSLEIPEGALYGIQSLRTCENFPVSHRFPKEWYVAMGTVKLACYTTYKNFTEAVIKKYGNPNDLIRLFPGNITDALMNAGVKNELINIPNEKHLSFTDAQFWEIYRRIFGFLEGEVE